MKIYGPYIRKDGRKHIILYDEVEKKRKTISYPRYLMQLHLERELEDWETVDHKDGDYTNDDIKNLQILSRENNIRKTSITGNYYSCSAENCDIMVWRNPKEISKLKHGPFCSNSCRSKTLGNQYCSDSPTVEAADLNPAK